MQRQLLHAVSRPRRRRGLAPLEFVLALPLMLFVMALIINIGSVGAWKVRMQANVRNASWRTLHLRTGDNNPNPPLWPAAASVTGGTGDDLGQTDPVWNGDPDLSTPAVRGPFRVEEPNSGMSIRVNRKLEMKEGVHDGRAPLERTIPLLRGILPNNGAYRFDIRQNVLDGMWEFHNMGYSHNRDRRTRLLYEIEPDDFPSVVQLKAQLDSGPMQTLQSFPLAVDLAPLDADPDLMRLSVLPPQPPRPAAAGQSSGQWAPDFYPRLRRSLYPSNPIDICEADPDGIRNDVLERYESRFPNESGFLNRIRHLPGTMARRFLSWYTDRRDYLQNQQPPPAGAQQEIQWLQDRIDELNKFLAGLPLQNR